MKQYVTYGIAAMLSSCGNAQEKKTNMPDQHPYTNTLAGETSPYLLQHAHNPVNWHPWGEAALEKARKEDKLLVISIGYAACHWCHVMEHESFEDTAVAAVMNAAYVSVKVDREERPDVDQVYMNAIQAMGQQGGWPLNVIALPDGRPVFAGTYFRKDDWIRVLEYFHKHYGAFRSDMLKRAEQVTAGVRHADVVQPGTDTAGFTVTELKEMFDGWQMQIDFKRGGGMRAPKFPLPNGYLYLLRHHYLTGDAKALEAVTVTLDNMAAGGIYDQVGGGFARYSTDAEWIVPHFEKMLYDNGQLVSLYAEAWQLTKNPRYKQVVYETLDFVARELTSPEGGFYSSLDADSEGEEGRFYVWTAEELRTALGKDAGLFMDYYEATERGNWEHGRNILYRRKSPSVLAKKHGLSEDALYAKISAAKARLLAGRSKRVRPALDDKTLASWNALMLKGYVDAWRIFGEQRFLDAALKNAEFIAGKMSDGSRLWRNYKDGRATINGFLDDYAFVTDAYIALYQVTFDERWLQKANDMTAYVQLHFRDSASGMFFYTSASDKPLLARSMELTDNVIPASNSAMAKNLYVLGQYYYNEDHIKAAMRMLGNVRAKLPQYPAYHSNWAILMSWLAAGSYEVAIVGKDWQHKLQEFSAHYLPDVFFMGGRDEGSLPLLQNKLADGQTTIYVCRNKSCRLPVTEVGEALKQLGIR